MSVTPRNNDLDCHLQLSRDIGGEDVSKCYPGIEIAPFYGITCLHTKCQGKKTFYRTQDNYKEHLNKVCKLSQVADVNRLQIWWKKKRKRDCWRYDAHGLTTIDVNQKQTIRVTGALPVESSRKAGISVFSLILASAKSSSISIVSTCGSSTLHHDFVALRFK
jgi:hypothetical protein